ncbi:MAG: hypothetical protein ABL984_12510 [Pyrinomonadaceae bacterium]
MAFSASPISASCPTPEGPQQVGEVIRSFIFKSEKASEMELLVTATANTSWQTAEAEAAVLSVFLDGRYSQDIILFAGDSRFDYKALLGRVEAGEHKVELALNRERSAAKAANVSIRSARVRSLSTADPIDRFAVENSPVIFVRPDAVDKFSDIPLLTYYEVLPLSPDSGKIRYTTIFTNEDGGTQTAALMARWGRATDIEWVTEITYEHGRITAETFQAANHETKIFGGQRVIGSHPQILTATVNNNFADHGCSALKIANVPFRADLSHRSRENVMDEFPWVHRIMAQEAIREGRVDPANMGPNVIDDPRNYLYVDVYAELSNASVSVQLKADGGKISSSDASDPRLRIGRSGFQRTAVRLPSRSSQLASITITCNRDSGDQTSVCRNHKIIGVLGLSGKYEPVLLKPGKGLSKAIMIDSK